MLHALQATPPPIVCGEWGTPEPQRWSDPVELSLEDRQAIAFHERAGVLQTRPLPSSRTPDWSDVPLFAQLPRNAPPPKLQIAGTDHVGVLALPSGRQIRIRPKVGGLVLLDWLAYLEESPPVAPWLRDSLAPQFEGGSLEPALAGLFLSELQTLTRLHFRKQYVLSRRESATVRGKVLATVLARRLHRLPTLPQSSPARTWDTPAHALLAAALDRVAPLVDNASGIGSLSDTWSTVARPPREDLPRLLHHCRHSSPPGYGPALQLARLILQGCSPVRPAASVPRGAAGPSFLLSVAGVWERALRRMCRDVSADTGWQPAPDAQRTRRWHDGAGTRRQPTLPAPGDPPRWMTADVLLESPAPSRERWVLDAKYKCGFGVEDRADRFQAAAYAVAFDAGRGSLVYPTAEGAARRRLLLAGEVAGRRVTIDSLELPMSAGPQACREALRELIRASVQ